MCILKRVVCVLFLFLVWTPHVPAQVPGPPPPETYFVTIRYRILSLRDTHVAQYDALIAHLKRLQFQFLPPLEDLPETDREDRTKNQLTGPVSSANALKILQNPDVASIMLVPSTFVLPKEPERQVHVRLELNSGLPTPEAQFQLHQQVLLQLSLLGFREAPGYDHRGYSNRPYTRIVGVIPAGELGLLLRDLRLMPLNWFDPPVPVSELPGPLREALPILVTEVLPDPEPLREPPIVPTRNPPYLERIATDLWELIQQKEPGIVRIQLILVGSPSPTNEEFRFLLRQTAPSLIIEGWLGPVVTATVAVDDVPRLAAIPEISALRLARARAVSVDPKTKTPNHQQRALELSGLADLHKRGYRGKGVRLAILDTDFRGWDKLVAEKKLPRSTRFVDLATIPDEPLKSVPGLGNPKEIGHGSHCALAATLAAPEAELVLIRIAGSDPYQMVEAERFFRGGYFPDALSRKRDELLVQRTLLMNRRDQLLKERPDIIRDFKDERELEINFGFLGPVMGWIFSERQLHFQQMDYQGKLERELGRLFARILKLTDDLENLKGITLVASALNWQDGYPLGGASTLSRWLHLQDRDKLLWFQSAGNYRGQAWTGPFRDVDKNGFMEFAHAKTPLKKGRWTHEINFLGWQPYTGRRVAELPAQARVRVSLQWREPHDPDYFFRRGEEDYYLKPLAALQLHILKQRDPSLRLLPADAFELVGRSRPLPVRLLHLPSHTFYEQSVEFTVDKPARFAVQIDRPLPSRWTLRRDPFDGISRFVQLKDQVSPTLKPLGVPILPNIERNWELRVRLFVDVLDEDNRPLGRPVFLNYSTDEGSIGLPADSLGVFTVGAVDVESYPFTASALGPPAFQQLSTSQPDLWAYADLALMPEGNNPAYGSSLATMFTAGLAASMLSKCSSQEQVAQILRQQAGKIVRVPLLP